MYIFSLSQQWEHLITGEDSSLSSSQHTMAAATGGSNSIVDDLPPIRSGGTISGLPAQPPSMVRPLTLSLQFLVFSSLLSSLTSIGMSALVHEPGLNSVCARPHLPRFLHIRVKPGFQFQPTHVFGLKVGRNWVSQSVATWMGVSDTLECCTVEDRSKEDVHCQLALMLSVFKHVDIDRNDM